MAGRNNSVVSKKLFERAQKVSPGGVHSPVRAFKGVKGTPLFMTEASGVNIQDVDGNRYIDYCMSWGPLMLGHQDPDVLEAVKSALHRGWTLGTAEPYSLELAEFLCEKIPFLESVRFVNSGTEATMTALRVARGFTGRNKIVKFIGSYHGHVDSLLVKAGSGLAEMASSDSAGVSEQVASETIALPLADKVALEECFKKFGNEIAACIIEPLPANNGLLVQDEAFLKHLREVTRKYGSLLIFDEVISGFRVAFGGMAEKTGITPDLVTYGKVIGGGFPVGAYGGRKELMECVAPAGPVYQAGTLSANPIAMVAGLETLKKIDSLKPFEALEIESKRIETEVKARASDLEFELSVPNFGAIFWIYFGNTWPKTPDEISPNTVEMFPELFHKLLDKGIYLSPSAYEVNFLSVVHTPEINNRLIEAVSESLREMKTEKK